jgi:hypothetical protein
MRVAGLIDPPDTLMRPDVRDRVLAAQGADHHA